MTDLSTMDPDEQTTDDAPTTTSAVRRSRRRPSIGQLLPWLLVGALGAALAVIVPEWNHLRQADAERVEVATVARDVITALTTWDASDGLEDTVAELASIGTGSFADDVEPFFAGPREEELVETGAASTAVVRDLFVQTIDGDDATVFVTLDQSISTQSPPASNILPRRAIIDLQRSDGVWLASDVTVTDGILGPEAQS